MNLIQKEIKANEAKIQELETECEEWEAYNKCENDITRSQIQSLKRLNKSLMRKAKKVGINV